MVEELSKRGVLHSDNFQKVVVERGDIIAATALEAVRVKIAELAESVIGRLKLISAAHKLTIPARDGKRTIAKAKTVFTWGIDGDFKNWGLDLPGLATPTTDVEVHEMVKDGTFADIYAGTGRDLDKLVLTQDQVIAFVETHKAWLRTEGYGTFFLLKQGAEFFVASVDVDSDGTVGAGVRRFSDDFVWVAKCRHRFVLPQLSAVAD